MLWDGFLCVPAREHGPPGEAPHRPVIYTDHTVSDAGGAVIIRLLPQCVGLSKKRFISFASLAVAGRISWIPSECKRTVSSNTHELPRRR